MMTHDEMIAVIAHHKNGGKVEAKSRDLSKWREVSDPSWNFDDVEFRIKPEPLVLWAAFYPDGGLQAVRTTEAELIKFFGGDLSEATIKKFVEVTE